jgi:transcriptional regulator
MYVPSQFREDRVPVLHDAIEAAGLATLVTMSADGFDASHVPLLLDRSAGDLGTLYGHIAKPNPQWKAADPDLPALAIFLGPDAYVTPSWYATKQQSGKVVPTWNYVAIHAHGRVTFFDDDERLLALVTRLTERREAPRPHPWAVSDAPAEFIRAQVKGIVGFELRIAKLEGKWKMSQNRTAEDRAGVVQGLVREGEPAVAALVERGGERR